MKLSRLFGPEIASGLDLSKNMHEINENEDHVYPDDDFSRTLFSMLQKIGFGALSFRKTPFDALLTEKMRSVALMEVSKNILLQEEKIRSMKGIADVIGNESIIVPRERTMKVSIYGCPILSISDFRSINDPDDFLELIEKKKSMR
jgi:predicted transcriptional regulator